MTVEGRCGSQEDLNAITKDKNNDENEIIENLIGGDTIGENVAIIINDEESNLEVKNGHINSVEISHETTVLELEKNGTNVDRNGRRENQGTSDDKFSAFQTSGNFFVIVFLVSKM